MSVTTSTTASTTLHDSAPGAWRRRRPWPLLLTLPMLAFAAITCYGAVYFGTHPDPTRPPGAPEPGSWQAVALIVVIVAYALTAIVSLVGTYRRSLTAWRVALGYVAAMVLFGLLKFLGLGEDAALVFVVVDALGAVGLLAPQTRRWLTA